MHLSLNKHFFSVNLSSKIWPECLLPVLGTNVAIHMLLTGQLSPDPRASFVVLFPSEAQVESRLLWF